MSLKKFKIFSFMDLKFIDIFSLLKKISGSAPTAWVENNIEHRVLWLT